MWAMDYYQTQYKILESRNLARRAVQKLRLTQHPDFLPQPLSPYQKFKSDILSFVFGFLRSLNPFSSSIKSPSSNLCRWMMKIL
jgi:uncharacterized protein involved in exopolysaccharide biosynthesis